MARRWKLRGPYSREAVYQARQRTGLDIGGDAKTRCEGDNLVVCPGPILLDMVVTRQYGGCEVKRRACRVDPGNVAATVQVGKGDMQRDIPLTHSQVEALGIDPAARKKIGCGSFACVYPHRSNPKLAVKITQDEDDVSALRKMQSDPRTVRLHRAFELQRNGMPSGFYALVVDRLKPLQRPEQITLNFWKNAVGGLPGFFAPGNLFNATRQPTFGTRRYRLPSEARKAADKFCADPMRMSAEDGLASGHTPPTRCAKLTSFTLRVHEAAGKLGIRFIDPSGANIMQDDHGKLVVSDMGYSWAGRHAPALLAGRRRKRRSKGWRW